MRLEARGWEGERPTPGEAPADGGVVTLAWPASAARIAVSCSAMSDAAGPPCVASAVTSVGDARRQPLAAAPRAGRRHPTGSTRDADRPDRPDDGQRQGIAPEDRFVALPSRRVLAAQGGRDYEVRIEYKGRERDPRTGISALETSRDNYSTRPSPRHVERPARAGRSRRRPISRRTTAVATASAAAPSPASIDISDAAFYRAGHDQRRLGPRHLALAGWQIARRQRLMALG